MKLYVVGGAIRDQVLGLKPHDFDFVVVGATVEEFQAAFNVTPIEAQSFPIFVDRHGYQYAMARRERKTGPGYHGFEVDFGPDVTLEEDLSRRDFTMNAMAREVYQVQPDGLIEFVADIIIDPFGGQADLRNGWLNVVGPAFSEDPVRALRAARFAAKYNLSFTNELYQAVELLIANEELDNLTPERVLLEVLKAMEQDRPYEFFEYLTDLGILRRVTGLLYPRGWANHLATLDVSKLSPFEKLAVMNGFANFGENLIEETFRSLKAPADLIRLAVLVPHIYHVLTHMDDTTEAIELVTLCSRKLRLPRAVRPFDDEIFSLVKILEVMGLIIEPVKLYVAAMTVNTYGFDDLTEEQKASLVGPQIGEALFELRVKKLDDLLRAAYS